MYNYFMDWLIVLVFVILLILVFLNLFKNSCDERSRHARAHLSLQNLSTVTAVNPTTGELMIPSQAGVILAANNGAQAIRIAGSATTTAGLVGVNTTANQIQFFANTALTAAVDVSGLYVADGNNIYLGTDTKYLRLNHTGTSSRIDYDSLGFYQNGTNQVLTLSNGSVTVSGTLSAPAMVFGDGSALVTGNNPNLDYSTFGQNFGVVSGAGSSTLSAAMSSTGQYQILGGCNQASYVSNNFGQTWSAISGIPTSSCNYYATSISVSGQYQIIGNLSNNTVYTSSNYGASFAAISGAYNNVIGACMSASGQYQVIIGTNIAGYYWYSNNYGVSFTRVDSISGTSYNLQQCAMSASGQYVIITSSVTSSSSIFVSSTYGVTFTQLLGNSFSPAITSGNSGCSISASGQYMFISSVSNGGYVSTNYGQTWSQNGLTSATTFSNVHMCNSSGQYAVILYTGANGGIYVSNNYGTSYTPIVIGATTNVFRGCMSTDGKYMLLSNYTGSPYASITRAPTQYVNNSISAVSSYADGSALVTGNNPNLDYSTFGKSIYQIPNISSKSGAAAMSATGQYQISFGYNQASYISTNFGQSWVTIGSPIPTASCITNGAMSASGQYMTIVSGNATIGTIYTSSNFGASFTSVGNYASASCVALSASGQYQYVCAGSTSAWSSNNYGQSWSTIPGITGSISLNQIACSASGQYVAISDAGTNIVLLSSNYGSTVTTVKPNSAVNTGYSGLAMSASGQYIFVGTGTTYGAYVSTNYGQTWSQNSGMNNTNYNNCVLCSASGQYSIIATSTGTTGTVYYSTNFGASYTAGPTLTANTDAGRGAMSADGHYIIISNQYTGYAPWASTTRNAQIYGLTQGVTIGYQALQVATTGYGNTCVGFQSGQNITTASQNCFLGPWTGQNVTTGNNNICIGSSAGLGTCGGAATTTGENNIYIGNCASGSASGNSYEIVIGVATAGNGSNTCTINASNGLFCNGRLNCAGVTSGGYIGFKNAGISGSSTYYIQVPSGYNTYLFSIENNAAGAGGSLTAICYYNGFADAAAFTILQNASVHSGFGCSMSSTGLITFTLNNLGACYYNFILLS